MANLKELVALSSSQLLLTCMNTRARVVKSSLTAGKAPPKILVLNVFVFSQISRHVQSPKQVQNLTFLGVCSH